MKKRRSYNRKQAYIDKYGPAGAKEILKLQGKTRATTAGIAAGAAETRKEAAAIRPPGLDKRKAPAARPR